MDIFTTCQQIVAGALLDTSAITKWQSSLKTLEEAEEIDQRIYYFDVPREK
jgi:hypothetical protein